MEDKCNLIICTPPLLRYKRGEGAEGILFSQYSANTELGQYYTFGHDILKS